MYSYPYPYSAPAPSVRTPAEHESVSMGQTFRARSLAIVKRLSQDWRYGVAAGGALCVGLAAWGMGDSWRLALPQTDDDATASSTLLSQADAAQTAPYHFHIIANEAPPPPLPAERPIPAVMETQDADTATTPQAPASAPASDGQTADPAARVTPASLSVASDTCAGFATPSARLLCASPALAERDRRLRVAYGRALEASNDPDELQSEQTRWMILRDQAAASGGEAAVAALYDRRIQSLDPSD